MKIHKIGNIELTERETKDICENNKYIVCYSAVYKIFYSQSAGYYGKKVYSAEKGKNFMRRGRFCVYGADDVNRIIGYNLFN